MTPITSRASRSRAAAALLPLLLLLHLLPPPLPSPALKRRIPRSASHSNHDVKWPTQEENVIKETLEGWGKRVKEG